MIGCCWPSSMSPFFGFVSFACGRAHFWVIQFVMVPKMKMWVFLQQMLLCYQSSFFSFFLFSRHVYDEKSLPVMLYTNHLNTNHQDAWTLFGIQPQNNEHSTFQSTEMGTPSSSVWQHHAMFQCAMRLVSACNMWNFRANDPSRLGQKQSDMVGSLK